MQAPWWKICRECKKIGAELPVYELIGTTLRINFKALESALIDQPKAPKDHFDTLDDTLAEKIIVEGKPVYDAGWSGGKNQSICFFH